MKPRTLAAARSAAVICGFLALAPGCARQLSLRSPGVNLRGARVALMPAMVALYDLEADGSLTFDDAQSKRARIHLNGWLHFEGATMRTPVADLRVVAGTLLTGDAFYTRMNAVTRAIIADGGHRPLEGWELGEADGFRSWITALKADYVVFIAFRGAYPTKERLDEAEKGLIVGAIIGGAVGGAVGGALFASGGQVETKRAAMAVVDLNRARVVRFQTIDVDELDNEHIHESLNQLLASLELH